MFRGKKYRKAVELYNQNMAYTIDEAVELLEKTNTVKFDPSVEIHFDLNLDPKYEDQKIRTTISLPNWSWKTYKICVFTDSFSAKDLEVVWATKVGWIELIEDIEKWNVLVDFDVCVASPSMMRHMWKIARILWPKGIMPNPKVWTVWEDLISIVKEISAWKFEFRNDKQWNVHSIFWKLSFWKDKLKENLEFFINTINEIKPSWTKSKYINSIYVCNAMGPSIKLNY